MDTSNGGDNVSQIEPVIISVRQKVAMQVTVAYKNKIICNDKTGQDIKFILTARDTNGKLLEMETTYNSLSKEPV